MISTIIRPTSIGIVGRRLRSVYELPDIIFDVSNFSSNRRNGRDTVNCIWQNCRWIVAAVTWHERWTNRYCIQDGFSSFCARGSGSAAERYQVFDQPRQLCTQVLSHVRSQLEWPAVSPHPRCSRTVPDHVAMYSHFDHHHGISGLLKLATSQVKTAPAND